MCQKGTRSKFVIKKTKLFLAFHGRILLFVSVLLLTIGCVAFVWVHRHQEAPLPQSSEPPSVPIVKTVVSYCQALTNDNISTAFDLLDIDTQRVVTKAGFVGQLDHSVLLHHGLRTCQLLDPIAVFQGEKANTIITLSYGNGSQDKLALALLEEDQHWKILFVSFLCTFPPGIRDPHAGPCCTVASPQVLFPQSCSNDVGAE